MASDIQVSGFFAPVDTSLLGALFKAHQSLEKRIRDVDSFIHSDDCMSAMGYFLKANREYMGRVVIPPEELMQADKALAALHADFWDRALRLTDVLECMPQIRRDEWYELIRSHATPAFSEDAVIPTLQDMLNSRERFLAERVDGIFQALSGEHVTNSPAAFGKRMILYVQDRLGMTHHTNCGHITDLRKIIARFMGRDEPTGWDVTNRVIRTAMRQTGEWLDIDGGALRIRCYMKGTAHLEVHPDVAWKLNQILAVIYPAAIPSEFRTAPKRKPKSVALLQKPLPFAVIEMLIKAEQHCERDSSGRNPTRVPNTLACYITDKFLRAQVNAVFSALGGVDVGGKYFRFDYDPTQALGVVISSGCLPDHKSHQYYPTPQELAELAVSYAGLQDDMTSLEPSAGQGGLADYMHVGKTVCVEVSELHCSILNSKGHRCINADFLNLDVTDRYDRIVMNPPFSDGRWQAHVEKAAKLLADDGLLVAIVPASASGKYKIDGFNVEHLSTHEGMFAGTGVSVCMLRIGWL